MRRVAPLSSLIALLALAPSARAGSPAFESGQNLPNGCGGNGCWTNYLRVTDLDGDHQLDVVTVNMQGLFSVGAGEPLVVYRNSPAGSFTDVSDAAVGGHVGQHRQVAIGDVDGDGDPDMYAPAAAGDADSLFVNDGAGNFTETTFDLGSTAGAARMGDLDGDGDLDLLLTAGYPDTNAPVSPAGAVYLNDGSGSFTELADATPPSLDGIQPIDVDLADVDGDFDLDAIVDTHQGHLGLWINAGDGTFADASDGVADTGNLHYGPGVCDVDGDGDLDLWVDNASGGMGEQLQINDGSGVFADETGARVDGNTGDDDNGVVCVDFDYDGDFDAVVVALSSAERYLDNDGSGNFSRIDGVFPGFADSSLWAEFGDLDGDARLDLVTGSGESGTIDRFYLGAAIQPADTTPPGFRAVQTLSSPIAADEAFSLRFAVFDNTVTDEGARLTRAWVQVAVDGGDATEIDAHFVGGDLLHAVIPGQPGDAMVELTPCASDWAGNEACAPAQQVQIGPGGATTTAADSGSAEAGTGDTSGGSASASASASEASASASASATGATAGSEGSGAGSSDTTAGQDGGGGGGGGGCGCVVGPAGGVAHEPRTAPSWLVVLGGLLAVRRRRVR